MFFLFLPLRDVESFSKLVISLRICGTASLCLGCPGLGFGSVWRLVFLGFLTFDWCCCVGLGTVVIFFFGLGSLSLFAKCCNVSRKFSPPFPALLLLFSSCTDCIASCNRAFAIFRTQILQKLGKWLWYSRATKGMATDRNFSNSWLKR